MKKQFIRLAGHFFPNAVVNMAFRSLTNPQVMKLRKSEFDILERATKATYPFEDFNIQTYTYGVKAVRKSCLYMAGRVKQVISVSW